MPKPRRRIKKATVNFISLCPRGANGLEVIYKDDDQFQFQTLTKFTDDFDEKGELLAVVYAPEMTDSQGDIASEKVIKEMMYDAAQQGEGIDVRHNEDKLPRDQAFVAERFLIQKGDPRFADFKNYDGEPVDVTGGWGTVLKINDAKLRQEYRDGKWNGVSMGGRALFEAVKEDDAESLITKMLRKALKEENGETDMDAKDLAKALEANNEVILKAVDKKLDDREEATKKAEEDKKAEALKKAEESKAKAPEFKGDPSDVAALKKHGEAVKMFNLRKDVDFSDADQVAAYTKKVEDLAKEAEGNLTPEQTEIKKLEEKIDKLRGASNQSPEDKKIEKVDPDSPFSKEQTDLMAEGKAAADAINKSRGYETAAA